jgi:hypothetical protein
MIPLPATARLVENEDVGVGRQPLADDDLLLVAARKRRDGVIAARRFHAKALDLRIGQLVCGLRINEAARAKPIDDGKDHV